MVNRCNVIEENWKIRYKAAKSAHIPLKNQEMFQLLNIC